MNQTKLLAEVLQAVAGMPSERIQRIQQCRKEIQKITEENGEDGMMALAIEGLTGAAMVEAEELNERLRGKL